MKTYKVVTKMFDIYTIPADYYNFDPDFGRLSFYQKGLEVATFRNWQSVMEAQIDKVD